MDSVHLPCGHAGICYSCAIENVARCETCPCCRAAVDQVVVYDRASRRTRGKDAIFRVVGPGAVKTSDGDLDAADDAAAAPAAPPAGKSWW